MFENAHVLVDLSTTLMDSRVKKVSCVDSDSNPSCRSRPVD